MDKKENSKIRLLIVEDSAFMRTAYKKMLTHEEIEIIDYATNGRDAVKKAIELNPDIITMDIEMPIMSGYEALIEIQKFQDTPIIMVSSLTAEGAKMTIDCLNQGAIDFIPKPSSSKDIPNMKDDLINKILTIGTNNKLKNRIVRRQVLNTQSHDAKHNFTSHRLKSLEETTQRLNKISKEHNSRPSKNLDFTPKIVMIGISTGGPLALQTVIPQLSKNFPVPIIIIQHMPPNFTKSLAQRLDSVSEISVKEAENEEFLKPGTVYFAPGGRQVSFKGLKILVHDDTPPKELYKPSFNVALKAAIENWKEKILAVVMTGMGYDGTREMTNLYNMGGYNMSQDIDTCVVAGMTGSAINANVVHQIQPLDKIGTTLNKLLQV